MATTKKTSPKKSAASEPYLTKRILVSAAKTGVKKAAKETMKVMGYTIIAKDGWVIKKYADGTIEKVSKLETTSSDAINLD
jgi:hypothetical protein